MKTWTAQTILETLAEHRDTLYRLGARKLGLFGSYARGEQTPDSDMDFVVVLARPRFYDYMDIKLFLEDLFGRKVDLAIEDGLREAFRAQILKEVMYVEGLQDTIERRAAIHPEN